MKPQATPRRTGSLCALCASPRSRNRATGGDKHLWADGGWGVTSLGAQGPARPVPLSPHRVWGDPGGRRGAGHREVPLPTVSQGCRGPGAGEGRRPACSSCPARCRPLSDTAEAPAAPGTHVAPASRRGAGRGGRAAAGTTGHWATALRTACHSPLAHFTGEGVEAQFPAQGHTVSGGSTRSPPVCPGAGTPPLSAEVPRAWSHSTPAWHPVPPPRPPSNRHSSWALSKRHVSMGRPQPPAGLHPGPHQPQPAPPPRPRRRRLL